MNKAQIKKLASLHGMKLKYLDENDKPKKATLDECLLYLNALGINTDSDSEVESSIREIELKEWGGFLDKTQVVKNDKCAVIKIKVAKKYINSDFQWQLIDENSNFHQGEFKPSKLAISGYNHIKKVGIFYQFDFPLPISLEDGYHTFKLISPIGEYSMKVVVTSGQSYIPQAVMNKQKKLHGAKLRLNTVSTSTSSRLLDSSDLKYIIRKIDKEKISVVSINAINQVKVNNEKSYNLCLPASKFFFNTLYLNIDSVINFIGDKNLSVRILSSEYEKLFEIDENEQIDYEKIYSAKLEIFKLIYQSFRQNHINQSTNLAKEFYGYIDSKGEKFRKIALFRALEEYFKSEDLEIDSWRKWPDNYQSPSSESVKAFEENNIELIQFYEFWQWQEEIQLEQVGRISYEKGLDIGLLADLPYGLDPDGADSWLRQDTLYSNGFDNFLLPDIFKKDCYDYFIEVLRANMKHVGAIKICDIRKYMQFDIDFGGAQKARLELKIEDMLGILSLESQRNKCLIICDRRDFQIPKIKQLMYEYNILSEEFFDFIEVYDEKDFKKIFIKPTKKKNIEDKKPISTYRLQLNKDFNFKKAQELAPYLHDLGISHCYISPMLKARSDSSHCYDIVDHSRFHPAIGSRQDFDDFSAELKKYNIGLICDIVPNHMGINHENKWWYDVLENGKSSEYADYFDIDWMPINKNLQNKVLVPVLGEHYGEVLNKGLLKLSYNEGVISLNYYDHKFPINPSSYPQVLTHRIEVLSSRLGSLTEDFLEYQSIITSFENLPEHTAEAYNKKFERKREKTIAINRLRNLTNKNSLILEFLLENLENFETKENDVVSCNRLNSLLENQAYHLAYWRVSVDEINYRRFFDINDLAAISVEKPDVFHSTHQFILELIEQDKIQGLRIDHPDGLSNPTEYFQRLQSQVSRRLGIDFFPDEDSKLGLSKLPIYIWAEKIQATFERLPENWAISGTVGYDFLNALNGIYVKKENKDKFTRIYRRFIERHFEYEDLVIQCKKIIMLNSLAGELSVLANKLTKIAQSNYNTRDFTYNNIRAALAEIIARFPVYRTYIFNENFYSKNADYIRWAVSLAKKNSSTELSIFDFIQKVLLLEFNKTETFDEEVLNFAKKFQQYTAPLMAKGLEDTAFYRYNRLVSLNEVGAEPVEFGTSIVEFHHNNLNRLNELPYSMLSTSTHDTKRSEDVRARINVLSEIPEKWQRMCNTFSKFNNSRKTKADDIVIPSKNDEYLFYQTLLGIWPEGEVDEQQLENLNARLCEYMLKAMREAKVYTSWVNMNSEYEDGVVNFINKVVFSYNKHPFWKEFLEFKNQIVACGNINSLSQTALKLCSPGVCDIYQGMETLKLQLVDPDNRGAVNFGNIKDVFYGLSEYIWPDYNNLPEFNNIKEMPVSDQKLYLTAIGLNLRKNNSDLIISGDYIPLEISGEASNNIISFARLLDGKAIIVVTPRFVSSRIKDGKLNFEGTEIILPEELEGFRWKNIINKRLVNNFKFGAESSLDFDIMPVIILESY